ncbi:MAG TPA: sulfatase-like hydrolase/transferase, partial [Candidatus Angelobacter sp.]|nr:sulfatase-like hydrolase/transferase [Candidatus Angelobacter sp.]
MATMEVASQPANVSSPASRVPMSQNAFWLKLAAQAAFGVLVLVNALYMGVCYITQNFFGFLSNPFFGWLQELAVVCRFSYFPLLLAGLIALNSGSEKQKARRLSVVFVAAQMAAGFLLLLSPKLFDVGWTLLYGADVAGIVHRAPSNLYFPALASLVPLIWMGIINFSTTSRSGLEKKISFGQPYRVFFLSACAISAVYWIVAAVSYSLWHQPRAAWQGAATLAAHWAVFTALFLVFQWIRRVVVAFRWSWAVAFILQAATVWVLLSLYLRRILFSALAFNSVRADCFAFIFCFAAALYISGLVLKIQERATASSGRSAILSHLTFVHWAVRILAVLASVALIYVALVRLANVDWNHIGAMLAASGTWLLAYAFFFNGSKRLHPYSAAFLLALSLLDVGVLGAIRWSTTDAAQEHAAVAAMEQYVAYDPSFGLIHQAVREVVSDSSYDSFYSFLDRHADISEHVNAPEVKLTDNLAPAKTFRPNIFIFVIDALRRDYVSAYNPAVTFTPSFQAFAQDSIVFQDAYTPFAGTILAEPSIWTGVQMIHKEYPDPLPRMNALKAMLDVDQYQSYISYDTVLLSLVPKSPNVTVIQSGLASWRDKEFTAVTKELESDLLAAGNTNQPVFAYSQPENVHSLSVGLFGKYAHLTPHPGFDSRYASAVQGVDEAFGEFIMFLKQHGYYENSVIVLTADHGESLGEWGRRGHIGYLTPEAIRIPLIIHLPEKLKANLTWDANRPAFLQDLTPTLYYLLGHKPARPNDLYGR